MNQDPANSTRETPAHPFGAKHPWLWTTGVAAAAALALFAVTLNSGTFIKAQDSILRLPLLSHGKHLPKIFSPDFMVFTDGRYRPLSYALIALVRTIVPGDNAVFWHAWLLAFHVLNALLVYAVARHFARRAPACLIALAVFLLHPLASAFGNQINLFHHVLGGSFYLGTFLCYLHYVRKKKVTLYFIGLVLFVGGLLTSAALLTLPLLILAYEIFYERTGVLKIVGRLIPFGVFALLLGYCFLTFRPHPMFYVYPKRINLSVARYWAHSFAAGGVDSLLALARGLSTRPPVSGLAGGIDSTWRPACIAAVLVALIAASAWGLLKKQWFMIGAFLLFLSTLSRFGSPTIRTADCASWSYGYLPLAGFALLAGALADRLTAVRRRQWRHVVSAAAVIAAIVLGGLLLMANLHARTAVGYWDAALKQNPHSEAAAVALGKAYLAEGNEEAALKYLFHPTVGSARESSLAAARHYARTGRPLAAAVHMEIAQREDVPGLQYQHDLLTKAEVMYAAGASDFAEQYLGWVVMANPYHTTALKRLAEIHAEKGYLPAAVNCLQTVADIDPWDRKNARRLKGLKERLLNPESYTTPARMSPPPPDWLRYASNQASPASIQGAVIQLADVLGEDPVIQLTAGIFLSEAKKHKQALRRIDRAAESLSSFTYAWATKCWAAANAGETELFFKTVEQVHSLKPRDADVWHYLGYVLGTARKDDLARGSLETALKANPYLAGVQNDLAALLTRRGELGKALLHYRKAVSLSRGKSELVHNGLGYVLRRLGRDDEAMVHFRAAIAIDPKTPASYRNMAMIFERKGRFDESVSVLSEGLKRVPKDVGLRSDLAKLLAAAPQDDLRDAERAVRLAEGACRDADPQTPEMLDVLAAAYAEVGRFDSAVVTARQAASLARSQRNPRLARDIEQRLRLYRMHKPFRMSPRRGPRR